MYVLFEKFQTLSWQAYFSTSNYKEVGPKFYMKYLKVSTPNLELKKFKFK